MKITRIDLPGFGCLSDFRSEVAPGLNLVYGENEAGKSTLQQAICAMLYGFFDHDRARPDETARHERFRPWSSGIYRGALEYELNDGRRFEVRRDFSTPDVITQLIDPSMGIDVSPQFGRGRHGNVPFARKHLGMSRSVFQSCAFISQGEIFAVEKSAPTQIGDAIAALADSGRRDVSAVRALERLDAALANIGSDRARTADLPVAREKLAQARNELAAADEAQFALADTAGRLDAARTDVARLADERTRTEYLLHCSQAARIRLVLQKIACAETAVSEARETAARLESATPVSAALRDEVLGLRGRLERAGESAARAERECGAAMATVSDGDRLEYETLRVSVGQLSEQQIAELQARAYTPAVADRPAIAKVLTAALHIIAAAARSLARLIFRRAPRPAVEPTPDAVPPRMTAAAEALALLEKHRQYLTLRPQIEALEQLDRRHEAERSGLATLEAQLSAVLQGAGIQGKSIGSLVAAFDDAWRASERRRLALEDLVEKKRDLELVLNGRSPDERRAALQQRETAAADLLREQPGLAACETTFSSEQLKSELDELREKHHSAELKANSLEEAVRLTLSRFPARAEIEEEVALHEREVERLEKARAAICLARDAIQEAMKQVYRDFAPAVNSFLSEGVEVATDGRYTRAHVDPSTLRVSLLVPETGQVLVDPPVSHGTRTLMYVLMRIGLAQHMSAIGEPVPLIIDDPFVDVDPARLRRMLAFLLKLSERMQVFLFTKDPQVLDWFEANTAEPDHRIHSLSTLSAVSL